MGRKCAVPDCYTGYRNTKEKAPLYRVPDDNILLTKWQEAIARADRLITPNDFVCAKHFRNDDLLTQRIIKDVVETYQRPRLRPDAIPSIFPDPPESIHGMVRKRRKLSAYESMKEQNKNDVNEKTDSDTSVTDQIVEKITEKSAEEASISTITSEIMIKEEIELPAETDVPKKDPIVNSNGEFCCDQCNYKTKWQTNLITHKVVHSTVYLHCEICPHYSTKWKSVMKNHMKTKHSLHKEIYVCEICRFESVSKEYMKKHKMNHSKQGATVPIDSTEMSKYYRCTICTFQDVSKLVVLSHIENVHKGFVAKGVSENKGIGSNSEGKRYFPCLSCSYKATSEMGLENHFNYVHKIIVKTEAPCEGESNGDQTDANYFPCLHCSYIGKSKSDTLNHLGALHQGVTVKKEPVCDDPVGHGKQSGINQSVQKKVSDSDYNLDSPNNHVVYIKTEIEDS
ncbi:unnamed protein product [Callosobruchus maculatus]|uniref:THAP-type domain-containing protein n=1 Tax=Callosobruchus maculatus TaxID=64391 RepID=A0A653CJC7_CALMS|nr:unnamed protein product [Callosobruchus maculatus]